MRKEIRIRCWITIDDEKFFGPGPAELLELIGKTGSIAKAAKLMGMSYKKAWDIVERLNEYGNKPYVMSHKGGEKGGGAEVTAAGKKAIQAYKQVTRQVDSVIRKHRNILKHI